jgi:hypothetical protein
MRLDFNVLWVDDQPDRVDAQIKAIAKEMEVHGFEFRPKLCTSVDEVRELVTDDVFTDEVDLILVDWDLGGNVQGQTAIAAIREQIQYKDVVFYSANNSADELRRLAFDGRLEGIYCVTRQDLVDEVVGVFESLVKKVLDLDHVRGIVMGATSDIDQMVHDCLTHVHKVADAAGQAQLLSEALKRVEKKRKDLSKTIEKLRKANGFPEILEVHAVFTANDRLRMLTGLLNSDTLKAHQDYRPAVVAYMEEVVQDRNILGHQVLTPEGKPISVTDNKGQQISLEQTRALRRRLLDLRSKFRDLLRALQGVT